ncbi:receptor-type tyrosine-protein phosphatase alpha isoform X3 [Tribolium castaneum]|uniref:receptor-type tyrosine-protein phosphatase alpha isoform X3 n=1 Tax=Tribolium castaneum TaxID=7070 RepID=UPI0030FF2402
MHLLKVLLVYVFLISPIKCVVGETSPQLIYELSEITKNLTDLSNIIDDNNYMTGDKKEEYVFTTLETIYVKIGGLNQSLYRDEMFQENLRGDKGSCNVFQSSRQLFDNFINGILLIHSESFVLEQTAFSIKNLYEQAVVGSKMQQSQDNFIVDINIITRLMKHYAEKIPTEMWRCHPDKHIKGETYLEITNFLHGYLVHQRNLDPQGRCVNDCKSFKMTKFQQCVYDKAWCKEEIPCARIISCSTSIDSTMEICPANFPEDNRRYYHIKLHKGTFFGTKEPCNSETTVLELNKYYSYLPTFQCPYCFCLCEESHTLSSDRYINLRISMVNISDNRVVTGLRFIKHNRIIHLQVQEGKLLQRGYVDPKTVQWVPPEDYKITDRYISKGQDYHTFSWEGRIIELTEIKAEEGSVVTGVRFIKKMDSLSLQVVTTAFDFNTGKLEKNPNCSTFKSTPNFYWRHKFKENVKLESPDIPIRKNLASTDFSKNKCIKFTNTDYQKDAGQTTIPFFDAQPVNSTIPTPLSGVGLFHKGHKGSGGFIAPKIFTYDFSKYILVIHAETRPMSNKPITNSQTSHMATNYKEKTNNFSKDNVTKPSDVKASHLSSDTTITKYKNSTQSPRTPSLVNRKTKTAINVTGAINTITVRPDRDNEEDISLTITMIFILVPQLLLFIVAIIIFKKQLKKICVKTDMDRRPETIPLQNIVIESHNLRNIKKENFIEYLICNLETNELEDGFLKLPTVTDKTTWEALRNINNNKNRHCKRNNLPYDYNRVVLKKLDGVGTGDYINASYINGVDRSKAYIASQGPKYYTLRDFWRMIWQEKVEVIVMATNFINDDGNKRLCAEYLPPKVDSIFECGRIIVELIDEENYEYYVKRKLKVRYLKFQREICHIHIHWQSDSQLLYSNDLMPVVKEINQLYEKTLHPVLIHSGYGTTRTGVLILCDMALKMLKSCNTVNIYDLAKKLAEQRCSLINSSQQYILVHLLISEYIMEEDCPLTDSATESLQEKDAKNLLKYIEELCYYDKIVRSWMPKATETNIPTIFADGYGKHENYIVTQLRRNVENKSAAFWMLVADKSVDCIVSLSNVTMQLYPCRRVYENVVINIEFIKVTETPAFVLRTMSLLIYHKITQTIQHKSEILLYEVKDAKQSPTFANNILTLICDVKKHNKIVVSCSDGVTTCGLFLVLAYITDKFKAENKIDIVNAIRVARRTGIEFFNTKKHLQMLNTCISKYLENFGEYTLIDECSPNTK